MVVDGSVDNGEWEGVDKLPPIIERRFRTFHTGTGARWGIVFPSFFHPSQPRSIRLCARLFPLISEDIVVLATSLPSRSFVNPPPLPFGNGCYVALATAGADKTRVNDHAFRLTLRTTPRSENWSRIGAAKFLFFYRRKFIGTGREINWEIKANFFFFFIYFSQFRLDHQLFLHNENYSSDIKNFRLLFIFFQNS